MAKKSRDRIQKFDDVSHVKHWVAVGRVPGPFFSAIEEMVTSGTNPGMQFWHPHFGQFSDHSLDLRLFLRKGIFKRPIISPDMHKDVLDSILNADEVTLVHAISGNNTLERISQLQEFAYLLLYKKMKKHNVQEAEARHLPPHLNVILTKGYGDRNDIDFSDLQADNFNPNAISIRSFVYGMKSFGLKRLFFTEPHSFEAMRHMIDIMGEDNVCFPTLSDQFTNHVVNCEALQRDYGAQIAALDIAVGAPDGGGKWRDTKQAQASLLRGFNQLMAIHDGQQCDMDLLNNWQTDPFMQDHFLLFDKKRMGDGRNITKLIHGNVKGKLVVLVDDVSASGGTIIDAARICYEHGAVGVVAALAHPGFVRYENEKEGFTNALERMMSLKRPDGSAPLITRLMVGGTVPSFYHRLPQWVTNGGRERVQIVDVHDTTVTALANLNAHIQGKPAPEILGQIMPAGYDLTFSRRPSPSDRKLMTAHPGG